MRAAASIDIAGRIDQRSSETLRGNADVERNCLAGDHALLVPRRAGVERAIERDGVRGVIVPCDVKLAVRADEWNGADCAAGPFRIIRARHREGGALIARRRQADSASGRAADRRVPRHVDVVAERRGGIRVRRDHRLVVEVIFAAVEREVRHARIRFAAIRRFRYGQLSSVDAVTVSEEDDDVTVKEVAARVERQRRIRAEIDTVRADRRRKRSIDAAPRFAAVAREISAHRQTENLVGSARQILRVRWVDRDVRLALRAAFVRHVHVAAGRNRAR